MERKNEIAAKKAKLAELRRQREEREQRQKNLPKNEPGIENVYEVWTSQRISAEALTLTLKGSSCSSRARKRPVGIR